MEGSGMGNTSSWEQQPEEQAHMYAAARVYFDLGPERSLRVVAQRCGHKAATVARWSARHNWVARARAYDEHHLTMQDRERRELLEQAAKTEAQKWLARLQEEREEEWETARALIARAREMLASPLEDTKWNWRDAGVLIEQAAKLVRLAAGEPDEEAEKSGEQTLTVRVEYKDEPPTNDY